MKNKIIKILIKNNFLLYNYIKKILYYLIKQKPSIKIINKLIDRKPYFNIGDKVLYNNQLYEVIWIDGIINNIYMYKIKNNFEVKDLVSEILLKKYKL